MKFSELINDSPAINAARFYKFPAACANYNSNTKRLSSHTQKFYKDNFGSWYEKGVVPVFTKPDDVDTKAPKLSSIPGDGKVQSPGYRGLQKALALGGLPHAKVVKPKQDMSAELTASLNPDLFPRN